jgi:biopolymer transport protein ExbB
MRRINHFLFGSVVLAVLLFGTSTAWAQEGEQVNYLTHFFVKGGWVVWFIELPMSIAMVALSVMFIIEFRKGTLVPPPSLEQIRSLLEARQYREAIEYSANDPATVSNVVHASLAEASNGYPAMERAMEEAIDDWSSKSLRKIEYLNIIGNIAPMVGLFGTVFGMIITFNQIVEAGGVPNAAELASGISVALVTTFWGLVIAIPALSIFAMLRNRIEGVSAEIALEVQTLLGMFNPTAQRGGGGAAAPQAPPTATPAPQPPSPQA